MFRRLLAVLSILCLLLMLPGAAIYVRGKFTSDIVKIFHWNPANRHYSELHVVSQGGLLSLHHSQTVLAPDSDTTEAEQRAGPTGWHVWRYQQRPVARNAGAWISIDRRVRRAHAGVANPNGTSDSWIIETKPIGWLMVLSIPPLLWLGLRRLAARKLRRRIETGRCPACGYDLRASPERCPECGRPVDSAEQTPEPVAAAM